MKLWFPVFISLLWISNAQADRPQPMGYFNRSSTKEIKVPTDILENIQSASIYGDKTFGILFDLNEDKIMDFILRAPDELCGTGGCPYVLVDGATKREIGELFGAPIYIFKEKINGYPIIHAYAHFSASTGEYVCYVFDGKYYLIASSLFVKYDEEVRKFYPEFKDVPEIK